MRIHRPIQICFVFLAALGLAACAGGGSSSPGSDEPSGDGVSIRIENDYSPPTGIVVWAVPETGTRRRLGFVAANGQRSFRYSPQIENTRVYLLAEPEGPATGTMAQARQRQSLPFSCVGIQSVTWAVSQQNVRVRD